MKNLPLAFALALAVAPAAAGAAPKAATKPAAIRTITISLANRGFHPQVIRLQSGTPYRLRFINHDRTEHDFYAPDFFVNARVAPRDAARLDKARLNIPAHSVRSITLTPVNPAPYTAKSTKLLDVASNMTVQLLVY